jgi:autotransporter family porin
MKVSSQSHRNRLLCTIEPLESRIAPAAVTLTFTDVDGDTVKVTTSHGNLVTGDLTLMTSGLGQQLQKLNLTDSSFAGANVSITVSKTAPGTGNGLVNVGYIDAGSNNLGSVIVGGDLGEISAQSSSSTMLALKSLTVHSLGVMGDTTGRSSEVSNIYGNIGSVKVAGDFADAMLVTHNGGNVASITIGGSLSGTSVTGSACVSVTGNIGPVAITGNILGVGAGSGDVEADGSITGIAVGGSVIGGSGSGSGAIESAAMGAIKIGHSLEGGSGGDTGNISCLSIASLSIGGSVIGGSDDADGAVYASGNIGPIKIGGSVLGGTGTSCGTITSNGGMISSVKIGGSLAGASGSGHTSVSPNSGYIYSFGNMGPVSIGQNISAGYFDESGKIQCGGSLKSLSVGGSILGGAGNEGTSGVATAQGEVAVAGTLGTLMVADDVIGAAGDYSAGIRAYGGMGGVTIGGDIVGGAADHSGAVYSQGLMGAVMVHGSIIGGGSADTTGDAYAGEIYAGGKVGALKIGGSIIGGVSGYSGQVEAGSLSSVSLGGSLIGGTAEDAGEIVTLAYPSGVSGAITIKGSIQGGSASEAGVVDIEGGMPSIVIGGSIIGGTVAATGGVMTDASIGSIVVKGDVSGTTAEHAFIDAIGQLPTGGVPPHTDVAIKTISIGGDVTYGDILAGQDGDHLGVSTYQNGSAQIGSINIGGSFIGSSLSAGAGPGANGYGQDAVQLPNSTAGIYSAIASITIGGQAIGTLATDTTGTIYGIVAQEIGLAKIGGVKIPLTPGPGNDTNPIALGAQGGLNLYELAI